MTKKKHEELVKETVHDIEMYHRWASQGTVHHNTSQKIAEGIITSVLSAVRDGLPLPGEVGRREWNEEMMVMPNGEMWGISRGSILIALREEEEK